MALKYSTSLDENPLDINKYNDDPVKPKINYDYLGKLTGSELGKDYTGARGFQDQTSDLSLDTASTLERMKTEREMRIESDRTPLSEKMFNLAMAKEDARNKAKLYLEERKIKAQEDLAALKNLDAINREKEARLKAQKEEEQARFKETRDFLISSNIDLNDPNAVSKALKNKDLLDRSAMGEVIHPVPSQEMPSSDQGEVPAQEPVLSGQFGKTKQQDDVDVTNIINAMEKGDLYLDPAHTYMEAKVRTKLLDGIAQRKKENRDSELQKEALKNGDVKTAILKSWGNKQLDTGTIKEITNEGKFITRMNLLKDTLMAEDSENEFKQMFPDTDLNPILGRLSKLNPWNVNAKAIAAQVNSLLGQFAKTIGGDAGTLSVQDIENARSSIPDITKPKALNELLYNLYTKAAVKASTNKIVSLTKSGYDTRGLLDFYDEINQSTSQPSGMVKLQSPDGEIREFSQDQAKILIAKGAKVVE